VSENGEVISGFRVRQHYHKPRFVRWGEHTRHGSHNFGGEEVKDKVVKTYAPRGSFQQFRLSEATAFDCTCCKKSKKAKLVAIKDGDWNQLTCNGCYGQVLSEEKK
jgi:hypothetical protein